MYCSKCGALLENNAKFCSKCGQKIEEVEVEVVPEEQKVVFENKEEKGPWKVFAKLGNTFGILTFIFGFIPILNYISMALSQFGIVFSALGKKSVNYRAKANSGLIFSILGLVFSIIVYAIFVAILVYLNVEF